MYRAAYGDPKGYAAFLDPDPSREELGRAVHDALAASRFIMPAHPEWDTIMRMPTEGEIKAREEALKLRVGVKTVKALYTSVGSVAVTLRDGQIELHALRHRGRGAWEGIRGHKPVLLPESVSNIDLGEAVAEAIKLSRMSCEIEISGPDLFDFVRGTQLFCELSFWSPKCPETRCPAGCPAGPEGEAPFLSYGNGGF